MSKYRVLVVDDDINVIKALVRTLSCLVCEFCTTDNPEDAINELYSKKFDVIITDQRMPNITGLEILKEAQKIDEDILGILITAYSDMEVAISAINDIDLLRYIRKPWNNDELVEVVKEALNMRKEKLEQINRSIQNMQEIAWYKERVSSFSSQLDKLNLQTKSALLKLLEAKDSSIYEHLVRVAEYTEIMRMPWVLVLKERNS
jgi:DNA-binding NtrC family response regulator